MLVMILMIRGVIVKNDRRILKCLGMLAVFLLLNSLLLSGAVANTLTASTSLTIVHATEFPFNTAQQTITYGGDWPVTPTTEGPTGQEVYLNNVYFGSNISWTTTPNTTPYPVYPNTINSMIGAVWSTNGGQTFKVGSWDYLRNHTYFKGLHDGMPDCWMGTFVHTVCDRKAGECNGRNKSNVYFTEYPSGNNTCWGTVR
jgi:hypothetical protein